MFDDYDFKKHGNIKYDKTINVSQKDVIQDVIDIFSTENIEVPYYFSDELNRIITNIRNSYNVFESRHITCISARITSGDKWYLIHVWR